MAPNLGRATVVCPSPSRDGHPGHDAGCWGARNYKDILDVDVAGRSAVGTSPSRTVDPYTINYKL